MKKLWDHYLTLSKDDKYFYLEGDVTDYVEDALNLNWTSCNELLDKLMCRPNLQCDFKSRMYKTPIYFTIQNLFMLKDKIDTVTFDYTLADMITIISYMYSKIFHYGDIHKISIAYIPKCFNDILLNDRETSPSLKLELEESDIYLLECAHFVGHCEIIDHSSKYL